MPLQKNFTEFYIIAPFRAISVVSLQSEILPKAETCGEIEEDRSLNRTYFSSKSTVARMSVDDEPM